MLRKSKMPHACQLGLAEPCLGRHPFGLKTLCSLIGATSKLLEQQPPSLNSDFTGIGSRQEAGAMTGVPARQRPVIAPSSHLETSASNLGFKGSWFSVKLPSLSFWTQRDMP